MSEEGRGVTVHARSVDEAVLRALDQLGLRREEAEVEVIKQGGRSLLGLLREDAEVRVTAKALPTLREATTEVIAKAPPPPAEEAPMLPRVDDLDEIARLGAETLEDLMRHMGVRARVTRESVVLKSQTGSDSVLLNISGGDLGLLIGRRGETLRDLQFLTCLIVSRRVQRWPNVVVDVEHYRARREKTLVDLAHRMADRVRETAEPVPLEPMPPNERRIVHLSLSDAPDVFTESVGQADKRKVVIMPKQ